MSVEVELHMGEVRAVLKSGGVVGILQREATAAAGRCNALAQWHSPMYADAYKAAVDQGEYTAIGKVVMNSLGRDGNAVAYENAAHGTLLKGCGW